MFPCWNQDCELVSQLPKSLFSICHLMIWMYIYTIYVELHIFTFGLYLFCECFDNLLRLPIFRQFSIRGMLLLNIKLWFISYVRSVYKELHADRETDCWQQNKGWTSSTGKREVFSLFCCHALSALPWKCHCRRGGHGNLKRQENRAVIAWRKAAGAGLFSSADRAYMKAPVPRPTLRPVDKDFLLITL